MITLGLDFGSIGALVCLTPARDDSYLAECLVALTLKKLRPAEYQATVRAAIQKYRPAAVGVENIRNWGWTKVAINQGSQRALIEAVCEEEGIPMRQYDVRTARKALTGNGNATEEQVVAWIKRSVWFPKLDVLNEHICDACLVGLMAVRGEK